MRAGGFTIVVGRFLSTVVVTLRGTLDTLAATRLAATLQDLIDGQGNLNVALDARGVEDVAPSGMQVLSAAAAALERRGGTLWLSGPNDRVLGALDEARLSRLIRDPRRDDLTMRRQGRRQESPPSSGAATRARAKHPAGTGRRSDPDGAMR